MRRNHTDVQMQTIFNCFIRFFDTAEESQAHYAARHDPKLRKGLTCAGTDCGKTSKRLAGSLFYITANAHEQISDSLGKGYTTPNSRSQYNAWIHTQSDIPIVRPEGPNVKLRIRNSYNT